MSRIVSVWLPAWPLERLRRVSPDSVPDEVPFALVEAGARGVALTAATPAATMAGLHVGMSLADARAVCPRLLTRPAERNLDRASLMRFAHWCSRYAPDRNIDGEDGLWIDISGAAHLLGGEAALACDLIDRAARQRLTVRIGIADTHGSARALARYGVVGRDPPFVIADRGLAGTDRVLASLPVAALDMDDDTVILLRRLGLTKIGQLMELPRSALERRFRKVMPSKAALASNERRREGPCGRPHRSGSSAGTRAAGVRAAGLLLNLDRARGLMADPRVPLREPAEFFARRSFADPLSTAEAIGEVTRQLLTELVRRLGEAERGARQITLILDRVDGGSAEVRVGTSMPCRDPVHLMRLLGERIEGIEAGFGVDAMVVLADRVEALGGGQHTLLNAETGGVVAARERLSRLVDRLIGRFGHERVLVPTVSESHLPERAGPLVPIGGGMSGSSAGSEYPAVGRRVKEKAAFSVVPARLRRGARPAFLLTPPEPIDVLAEVPEGAPMRFTWRRAVRSVAKAEGPERIAPEWWRSAQGSVEVDGTILHRSAGRIPRVRDYYRLEDGEGRGYWVFRDGLYGSEDEGDEGGQAPQWFVHGVFA